ncbi:MAG: LCP family protein, partial [Evtepia sp.]
GDRKKEFYTFLVIGRDTGGGGNTDTMLLLSYDIINQSINVLSIPRDTMVNVSWDIKKINSVYNMNGRGDEGIKAVGNEVSQLVGFIPDFQVIVEWKAVGELVDALGGVWYDVPRDMKYSDPTQDLHINVSSGYQKLDGNKAMQVVRFRDGPNGYSNGDIGRIETQQGFLKAVMEQCLKIENATRLDDLTKVFKENVTTNLTITNIAWFGQKAIFGGLSMENVNFLTMPYQGKSVWSRGYGTKLSYVVPETDELVEMVNIYLNPYRYPLIKK